MKNPSDKYQPVHIDHTQADITLKDGTRPHIMLAIDEMARCILGYAVAKYANEKSIAAFRKTVLSKPADSLANSGIRHKRRLARKIK